MYIYYIENKYIIYITINLLVWMWHKICDHIDFKVGKVSQLVVVGIGYEFH